MGRGEGHVFVPENNVSSSRTLRGMLSLKPASLRSSILLVSAVSFVSATGAAGQACCSAAPQAGPGSVSGQGVGSLLPGQGWIQASVLSLNTDEQFGFSGAEEAYFNGGRLDLQSFQLTGAVGLVTGLEVWVQGVLHSLEFRDASRSSHRTGLGDVRVWLRAGPSLFGVHEADLPLWIGLRAGGKLPGSEFPVDRTQIPLTEGQKDAEVALEVGRVFADGQLAVQAWAGHRWRESNERVELRPGNEWFGYASVAGVIGPVQARLSAQILDGSPYETFGLKLPTSRRELFAVFPTLGMQVGPGTVEVGAQLPLAGRNLPAGGAFTLGYTLGFGEPPPPSLDDLFPE